MSGTQYNRDTYESRPEHHLHNPNQPLPGARPTTNFVNEAPGERDQLSSSCIPPTQSRHINANQGRAADAPNAAGTGAGFTGQQYDPYHGHSTGGDQFHNRGVGTGTGTTGTGQQYDPYSTTNVPSNRPMNVKPSPQGGVAIGGQSDLPMGYADTGDKIIGKTQKVMGKMTNNPQLHEKGELRESGGRAATRGEARAPHD